MYHGRVSPDARERAAPCTLRRWHIEPLVRATTLYSRSMHEAGDLLDRIRAVLAGGPPLRLAIVFGSAARGELRPDSDIDVGIVPVDPDLPLAAELDLQACLERACGRPVDLLRLDRASTLLTWEAARRGRLVLADSAVTFARFRARAALDHADLATVLGPVAERLRRRLAHPGAGKTTSPP